MFYVFVDTQVVRRLSFAFTTNPSLRALAQAVTDGRATVLLTSITDNEIRRHMRTDAGDALDHLRTAAAKVTKLVPAAVLPVVSLHDVTRDAFDTAAIAPWTTYCATLRPEVVDIDTIKPSAVMAAHFADEPPFSKKKPDEFRDAFVVHALRGWAEAHDRQVLVVSGDGDLEAACDGDRLVHAAELSEAIARWQDPAVQTQARTALATQLDRVKELLAEHFPERPLQVKDDPFAEAEDVTVDDVDIEPMTFNLIEFRGDQRVVSGTVTVHYSFAATIADFANGIIGKESDKWAYLPSTRYQVRAAADIQIAVRLRFLGTTAQPTDEIEVTIEAPKRLLVDLEARDVEITEVGDRWGGDDDYGAL